MGYCLFLPCHSVDGVDGVGYSCLTFMPSILIYKASICFLWMDVSYHMFVYLVDRIYQKMVLQNPTKIVRQITGYMHHKRSKILKNQTFSVKKNERTIGFCKKAGSVVD